MFILWHLIVNVLSAVCSKNVFVVVRFNASLSVYRIHIALVKVLHQSFFLQCNAPHFILVRDLTPTSWELWLWLYSLWSRTLSVAVIVGIVRLLVAALVATDGLRLSSLSTDEELVC